MPDQNDRNERGRQYNLILEMMSRLDKIIPIIDRQSRDSAIQAKVLYDMMPAIDTAHNYHHSENSKHRAEIKDMLEKFLAGAERDRALLIEHIIAIRTAAAVASNDAGDAKVAAGDAKTAATAARAAQESGTHKLVDAHGNPLHGGPRIVTPASVAGVAKELVKGLPPWAKFVLAVLALASAVFSGQALEARLKLFSHAEERQLEQHKKGTLP